MINRHGPQVVLPPLPEQPQYGTPRAGFPQPPGMAGMTPAPPQPGAPMPGAGLSNPQMQGQPPQMQQGMQPQRPQLPYQIGQFGLPPRTPNGPPAGIPPFPGAR